MTQTCATCKFFEAGASGMDGQCRKASPVPRTVTLAVAGGPGLQGWAVWPAVDRADWCGEWKPGPAVSGPTEWSARGV